MKCYLIKTLTDNIQTRNLFGDSNLETFSALPVFAVL